MLTGARVTGGAATAGPAGRGATGGLAPGMAGVDTGPPRGDGPTTGGITHRCGEAGRAVTTPGGDAGVGVATAAMGGAGVSASAGAGDVAAAAMGSGVGDGGASGGVCGAAVATGFGSRTTAKTAAHTAQRARTPCSGTLAGSTR